MRTRSSSGAPAKPKAVDLLLSPVNNNQLANLCGVLDENLRQIETAFDVSIARRGERFTLRGENRITSYNVCYTKLLRSWPGRPWRIAASVCDLWPQGWQLQ